MPTPHPPRPFYPPGGAPGESDESLAARLRGRTEGEATQSVALLMARHWQPTYDYAAICLASSSNVASMVAATSFHYALDCLIRGESGAALRPRLLVTVRDTVNEWSGEDRISGVLPDLRKPAGGRGMRAAQSITAENRKLAERSFQALPPLAQCLLWHTEVEAEDISITGRSVGPGRRHRVGRSGASHEQFRQGCVRPPGNWRRARNAASTTACSTSRFVVGAPCCRMSDSIWGSAATVGTRPSNSAISRAAWGFCSPKRCWVARRHYLDARRGAGRRAAPGMASSAPTGGGAEAVARRRRGSRRPSGTGGRPGSAGRHRLLARIPAPGRLAQDSPRSTRRSCSPGPARPRRCCSSPCSPSVCGPTAKVAPTRRLQVDGAGGARPAGAKPALAAFARPTDLQLNCPPADALSTTSPPTSASTSRGGKAETGAEAELAVCSSAWTQQWSYESDGLLRSVADPALCLDSHADDGVVALDRCVTKSAARGGDVRYDLTVRGELLSRSREGLAVTPVHRSGHRHRGQGPGRLRRAAVATTPPRPTRGRCRSRGRRAPRPGRSAGRRPAGHDRGAEHVAQRAADGRPGQHVGDPLGVLGRTRSVTVDDRSSARPALPLTAQLSSLVEGLRM